MTSPEAKSPERDPVAAAIYHCLALRHLSNYAAARGAAERCGADLSEHAEPPSHQEIGRRYTALADEWLVERYQTASAVMAALELAANIVADRKLDHIFENRSAPVLDELDLQFALWALTGAAHWTNQHANREYVQAEARASHRKEGAS
jgi:hypothetical protein